MQLAEPVLDICGRILLQKDIELNESSIRILKTWGVPEISIHGDCEQADESADLADVDPGILERAKAEISTLFRHAGSEGSHLKDLKRLATARKVIMLSKDADGSDSR
jgi:hypothetical protein